MGAEREQAGPAITLPDPVVFQAMQRVAAERRQPLEAVVVQALREWLEVLEESDDRAAIAEVEDEDTVSWEQVKTEMHQARADRRAG